MPDAGAGRGTAVPRGSTHDGGIQRILRWGIRCGALGLVLVKDIEAADSVSNLHAVGVACKILKAVKQESGSAHI
ncbi:MAG: hypothetical protein ACWGSQ_00980, partial [Longimicrobiales bacterium]